MEIANDNHATLKMRCVVGRIRPHSRCCIQCLTRPLHSTLNNILLKSIKRRNYTISKAYHQHLLANFIKAVGLCERHGLWIPRNNNCQGSGNWRNIHLPEHWFALMSTKNIKNEWSPDIPLRCCLRAWEGRKRTGLRFEKLACWLFIVVDRKWKDCIQFSSAVPIQPQK